MIWIFVKMAFGRAIKAAGDVLKLIRHNPMQAAIIALILLSGWLWHSKGTAIEQRDAARAEIATIRADAIARAKRTEKAAKQLTGTILSIKRSNEHEIEAITDRRDALLVELRKRPARAVSAPAQTARDAVGCTGAGLSASDGEFLARYAADAAQTAVTLKSCAAAYDAARVTMEGLSE